MNRDIAGKGASEAVMLIEKPEIPVEVRRKWQRIVNLMADPVVIVDGKGNFLAVNDRVEEATGFSKQELLGKNFLKTNVVTAKSKAILVKNLAKRMMGMNVEPYEIEVLTKDGEKLPFEVNAKKIQYEGKPADLVVFRDITQRKRAEEELRKSQEHAQFLADVLERSSQPFAVGYPDGRLMTYNTAYCKLLGYSKEELHKVNWFTDLTPPEWREVVAKAAEEIRCTGKPQRFEKEYIRKDGSRVPVEVFAHPIFDIKGNVQYYYSFFTDITERKKMEEQLKEYSEHLEEKVEERTRELKEAQERLLKAERLAAIGEVAGAVGHDLRNPLQVIVNTLFLVKGKLKSMPIRDRKIVEKHGLFELKGTLMEQVEYMNKIVSDLQYYARPLKPELVETSLHQLINDTLSTITVPENVKVSIEVEEDFKVMVDPTLMKRVFTNLVKNALQAMPKGGQLTIRLSKTEETTFVSIQDTGVGIAKENLPKLFQPLFTTKSKGTGFGLPACKRLVEAHNGSIAVESKVGRGSTFTVEIPLRKEVS